MEVIKCGEARNTYTITIYDEDDNIISSNTFTNITMSKRYFRANVSALNFLLGTMRQSDYKKYQSNGQWDEGWAAHEDETGGYTTSSNMSVDAKDSQGNSYWKFKGKIDEEDSSLWGTTVTSIPLHWSCTSISASSVTLQGKGEWGYHSQGGLNDFHGKEKKTYGIEFFDGGLASNGTLCSHFAINGVIKRPINKMTVNVTALFTINGNPGGQAFMPEGNTRYAHNGAETPKYIPTSIGFSGYPIRSCSGSSGGIVPIERLMYTQSFSSFGHDKPNDWDNEKQGTWFGFPVHYYVGYLDKDLYATKIVKEKDGVDKDGKPKYKEVEIYDLNDKGQKKVDWNKLKERNITSFGQLDTWGDNIGPIRSIVLAGQSAFSAPSSLIPGNVDHIQIGTGDGSRKRFYCPFTTEVGSVTNGYAIEGTVTKSAGIISSAYNPSSTPFGSLVGIYNSDGNLICPGGSANQLIKRNSYDKDKKVGRLQLNILDMQYYSTSLSSGLVSNWMVYEMSGPLKSMWIGGVMYGTSGGGSVSDTVSLCFADSLSELVGNFRSTISMSGSMRQHSQTTFSTPYYKRYCAIRIVPGGLSYGCYVGGIKYGFYDPAAFRFSTTENVDGYIEFSEAPSNGALIFIDANIKVPFAHSFTKLSLKYAFNAGQENNNGTKEAKK